MMFKDSKLNFEVIHSHSLTSISKDKKILEAAIQKGSTVLLEDLGEKLDPNLENLLSKSTFTEEGADMINLGDKPIPYGPDFNLFMTTKLANPNFSAETCIKLAIINFTVTIPGLE